MSFTRRSLLQHTVALSALIASAKIRALDNALRETGLKDVYKDDFLIGTAIAGPRLQESNADFLNLVSREFNSITMENHMKWLLIQPQKDKWNWSAADRFVSFGQTHNMNLVGHVLVWHSQVPAWVFKDDSGRAIRARDLKERMENHISTLVGRYKGRIHTWDVVNEAVDEGKGWRKSPWFKILGPKFMEYAFHAAHAADNNAHLIYNDYNMHNPRKRKFVVRNLEQMKKRGVPIHGIGMQGHVGLSFPDINEFEKSIEAYAAAGMRVHITEMDMDILPVAWDHIGAEISTTFAYSDKLDPYADGLPEKVTKQLTDRYVEFFKLFLKHRDKIDRVTFWGVSDRDSWKNDFPVKGRTNYPLLFDRQMRAKDCYYAIKALKGQARPKPGP